MGLIEKNIIKKWEKIKLMKESLKLEKDEFEKKNLEIVKIEKEKKITILTIQINMQHWKVRGQRLRK